VARAAAARLPFLEILIAMPGRLTLPARLRLRRKGDFNAAYARGRRLGDGFFAVTVMRNDVGAPRLGLAVAVKVAGSAVARNRLRRIIRESFRLHQRELPAADLVVSARPPARRAAASALRESLAALWKKVGAQCATSPPC
jgi:ribonuclease P protein component